MRPPSFIWTFAALPLALPAACADDAAAPATSVLRSPREAVDDDPDPAVVSVALTAGPARVVIGGVAVDALAFDGQVPGPTIRARVGDTIEVVITNALDAPTTVHWHGMHVPWAVDGVAWMQDPIAAGATRTVRFVADRAGTFWYHPHFDSAREVDRGLYGALVVEDPAARAAPPAGATPTPIEERVLVFDTWAEEAPSAADGAAAGPHTHGGVDDRHRAWIVNGLSDPTVHVAPGTLLHARLVNASNTGYLALVGGDATVIATDQGLLPRPARPDVILLAPGDRAEVAWAIGAAGFDVVSERWTLHGGALTGHGGAHPGAPDAPPGEPTTTRLFRVAVDADRPNAAAPTTLPWTFVDDAPTPDPGTTDIVWVLQGTDLGWMINGESFPDVTIPEVALGRDVIVEVRNLSPTRHPFHLHGMAFEVLSEDGRAPAMRTLEDTLDLPIRGVARLRVHADNPGDWMAHCHILPHAHGMMTILRVTP